MTSLWQTSNWQAFQESIGRSTWLLKEGGSSALVVKHSLPYGKCWLEVPRGPALKHQNDLPLLLKQIKKLAAEQNAIFVRFSPLENLTLGKLTKYDVHPDTTLTLDLTQSEEDLLAQMKPKGRYNIKVAKKHHVHVEPSEDVTAFYNILESTARRDGFAINPKSYYEKMLEAFAGQAQLLMATYRERPIAGGIFVFEPKVATYYYGASDHNYRNVMAPYLVQWEAIQEAKKRGAKTYDFLGIAPENTPGHRLAGVTDFKTKFGGQTISYPQAQEITLSPFWHTLYKLRKG